MAFNAVNSKVVVCSLFASVGESASSLFFVTDDVYQNYFRKRHGDER